MAHIEPITVAHIQHIAFELAKDTMHWQEPIPAFATRYPHVLESCIATPFQTFQRKFFYRGLVGKAAILFYLLIKNHPFQNGNKRIAVTTLFVFLYLNHRWLSVDNVTLYNTAVWVAGSPSEAKKEVVTYIERFLKKNIRPSQKP